MTAKPLRIVSDEFGCFDHLKHGDDVLVSNLCPNESVNIEAELEARGFRVSTRDLAEFTVPLDTSADWKQRAQNNVGEWGFQGVETLLLAMQEEMGELTQSHLEARAEDGDPDRVEEELCDLGALCFQLAWVLNDCSVDTDTNQEADDA